VTTGFADIAGEVFGPDAQVSEQFGALTVAVPSSDWVSAMQEARDGLGCRFFDWLSAVADGSSTDEGSTDEGGTDEGGTDGGFSVVAHVWSLDRRVGLTLTTTIARDSASLATATGVFRGANWHERETHEMFGIDFVGHPNLVPLLLPDQFDGHPLRKDFVLAARAAKAWPGAKEPGESGHAAPTRRKTSPPGVPDPSWGPRPPVGDPS